MILAYARISTSDQKTDRQEQAIKSYCKEHTLKIDRFLIDTASGKDFKREKYQALKGILRSGDILIIKELDRLGRNMAQIKEEWEYFRKNEISVIIIDTPILNTAPQNDLDTSLIANITFELLSYMAEKERLRIKQRQAEGIAEAKRRGDKLGRPNLSFPDKWEATYNRWKDGNIKATDAMDILNLKKTSFYKLVKLYEEDK